MQKVFTHLIRISLLLLLSPLVSRAQVVINESFDATVYPPYGWTTAYVGTSTDTMNYTERVTAGSNPFGQPGAPHSGLGMMRYLCGYMTVNNEQSYLSTRALDFTNTPAAGSQPTFWMYRDNVNPLIKDILEVYIGNTPFFTGPGPGFTQLMIQQLAPVGLGMSVGRDYTSNPATAATGWYQYQVDITQAYISAMTALQKTNQYLIFVFTNRHTVATGGNIYLDDISIPTWPKPQNLNASMINLVFQNTSDVSPGTANNFIVGALVNVDGGDDATAGNYYTVNNFSFSTIGSGNPCNDLTNAKLWWTGGTNVFSGPANATQIGATVPTLCATNYTFTPAATFRLHNGPNYFWLTYDVKNAPPAIPGNCVDAELNSMTVTKGTTSILSPATGTLPGCRHIDVSYCGGATPLYTVGTSWLGGSYTNNDYVAEVYLQGEPLTPIINNNLNCCGPPIPPWNGGPAPFSNHPPDYEKFPATANHTTTLMHGKTYTINLKVGTWYSSNYIAAWIDFNHDGVFALTERIAMSGSLTANGTFNASFTVPAGYTGNTILRVREVYSQSSIDPCATYTYGETEDYVVSIIPACAVLPVGFQKIWLGGIDDNWNTPGNWCPLTPPKINEAAIIPGGSPFRPVIYEGTNATALALSIVGNDTVTSKVYNVGSLIIADSLSIRSANSVLLINSDYRNKAVLSNGNLSQTTPPYHPFNGLVTKQRCQFLYTATELAAQGMITGDLIDSIYVPIDYFSAPSNPYTNYNIRYYYAPTSFLNFGTAFGNHKLADFAVGTTPIPVYSSASETITGAGLHKILLTTPIPVDLNYNLVIDICYDHVPTATPQQTFYTTTLGAKKYIQVYATGATVTAACDFSPTIKAMFAGAYPIGTTTFTLNATFLQSTLPHLKVGMVLSATNPVNIFPAGTIITNIAGSVITVNNPSIAAIAAGNQVNFIVNGTLITTDANCATLQRPNMIFTYKRPFNVFNIQVGSNWTNNGTFTAGLSRVTMYGSQLQRIQGTQITNFYDLAISKSFAGSTVEMWQDANVTDSLVLDVGRVRLNGNPIAIRTLNLLNGSPGNPGGFRRESGTMVAENNPPNYGRFHWQMKTPSSYPDTVVFPMADAIGNYLPVDYIINSGKPDVTITMYHTIPNNTPLPTGVNNIYQNTWIAPPATDNSPFMVDRFWQIDDAGSGVNRNLTFRWTAAENAASGASPYRAQVYNPTGSSVSTGAWMWPFSLGQSNPTATSVLAPNITYTNTWAVVRELQPLPVELLLFDARAYKDQEVICNWTTASEQNSNFFTVERSTDGVHFEAAGTVKAAGNSNEQRNYKFVDRKPYRGVSFYRLTQTDFDGKSQTFEKVAVNLSTPPASISVYPVPAKEQVVISIDPNVNLENAVLYVYDLTGRKVFVKTMAEMRGLGANIFVLPLASLHNGMYYFDVKVEDVSLGNGKFIVDK